eukprot:CAMPEP_0116977944 /NCGR_PEP_ID=MMETSP0467-20121206/57459_1 /TAXON_ID=283647 /ORGANISM="Mesodinium pulex, Strain SPMC105" /LENGTH=52 /DNA_ID=CAMNT_0004671163 /DNA_START=1503 /DNA_END=1658 /DNA_ORIENTATION=-
MKETEKTKKTETEIKTTVQINKINMVKYKQSMQMSMQIKVSTKYSMSKTTQQ